MDDATRDAACRLATSRVVSLDQTLQLEISEGFQDLINRGLYSSSVPVDHGKSAGERNLVERAELISNTIKEVCTSCNTRYTPTLADDLKDLFTDIYEKQQTAVQAYVEEVVPEQSQRMCPINRVQPDINRYLEELRLFAESLKHQKSAQDNAAPDRHLEVVMGHQFNVSGQAGAVGPNAHAHDITFQQLWNKASDDVDLPALASELRQLRQPLAEAATAPDHQVALGHIAAAAQAAEAGDGPKALEYLKAAGKWTFDTASKIGIGVAVAAAKAHLGF